MWTAIGLCRRVCVIKAVCSENNTISTSCRRCREVEPLTGCVLPDINISASHEYRLLVVYCLALPSLAYSLPLVIVVFSLILSSFSVSFLLSSIIHVSLSSFLFPIPVHVYQLFSYFPPLLSGCFLCPSVASSPIASSPSSSPPH